jgi:hypothetical protein
MSSAKYTELAPSSAGFVYAIDLAASNDALNASTVLISGRGPPRRMAMPIPDRATSIRPDP